VNRFKIFWQLLALNLELLRYFILAIEDI